MKKRLLASLLSLCLIVGLLPTAALATNEEPGGETPVVCTMDESCEAETHNEGCLAMTPAKTDEGPTAEEQLAELIAALPDPEDIDPQDEAQVEEVNNQISAIYAFAGENGLDVENNETINAVIAALYPAEPLDDPAPIDDAMSGSCGAEGSENSVTWALTVNNDDTINPTYTLTISGNGAMTDFSSTNDIPWKSKKNEIKAVVIKDGVTTIGARSFSGYTNITSITIPEGVTSIGDHAIRNTALTNVTIPASVIEIGPCTFGYNEKLTEISVVTGNTIYESKDGIVYKDNGATLAIYPTGRSGEFVIPNGVTTLGKMAFRGSKAITGVTIPIGVTTIEDSTFYDCSNLTNVTIPEGVTTIADATFQGCTSLESVTIPTTVTTIGVRAFHSCKALADLNIPGSVTTIGEEAFISCTTLTNVILPTGISTIEKNVFRNCSSLTSVAIPTGVTTIGEGAFNSSSLTDVTIPEGVTTIGEGAFSLTDLTSVSIPKSVKAIEEKVFYKCSALTSVTIPEGVTSIGEWAFRESGLASVTIPEGVTSIGDRAFYQCVSLKNVFVPDSATSIGENVFYSCSALKNISIPENVTLPVTSGNSLPNNDGATIYIRGNSATITGSIPNTPCKAVTMGGTIPVTTEFKDGNLAAPIKEGYIFGGWYADSSFTGDAVTSVESRKTYYAKWIELTSADISMEYGGSQATPTIEGVSLNNWTSANTSIIQIEGGQLKAVGVGSTTITADASPAISRSGEKLTVNVTVTPKSVSVTMAEKTETYNGSAKTIEATAGGSETLPEDLELVYSYKDSSAADSTYTHTPPTHPGTYTVKVESGNPNYTLTGSTSATLTISEPQDKADVSGNVAVTAPTTLVYDGVAKTYTATYEGINEWSIVYYDSDGEKLSSAPVNAGDYTVTINGSSNNAYASVTKEFTITPAALTITPNNKTAYVGDTLPTLGADDYTVTGLVGNDTLNSKPTLTYEGTPDMNTAGTYTIKASGASAGDNYEITYVNGTLTVSRRSSGGGGGSNNTTTETTKNPDGSTTTTVTDKKTGTVTETTKAKDGSTLVVETKKDGTVTTTDTAANGVKVRTVDEPGEDVTATVTIPRSVGEATVAIPADVDYGMVAVVADTGEIVKLSVPTEDGMLVKLDGSADLVLVDNAKDFTDTQGHWGEDAIDFATSHELFAGTSETTFTPDSPMTRAMLMTVLARFDGEDTTGGSVWYEKGMAWAIANGVSDGSNPNGSITREQFATMLWRYAGSPAVDGSLSDFSDSAKVNGYAVDAMRWAVSSGIISGMGDGTLAPQGNATRAQVATMLMRFVESVTK